MALSSQTTGIDARRAPGRARARASTGTVWPARAAVPVGIVCVAVGVGLLPFLVEQTGSAEAVLAGILVVAGAALTVTGTVLATRGARLPWRLAVGSVTLVVTLLVTSVVGQAVAATNVPRTSLGRTPADLGLVHTSVTLRTTDGVALAGWYLPSTNRAAVVLLHGAGSTRSSVLPQARVLSRAGFGVLLVDARGHGASGGRAMDFGWLGDPDIDAATRFLSGRPDVDPDRIGAVGMSMGGEEAIGATGTNTVLKAVVAEGATRRTADDEAWLSDRYGARGSVQEVLEHLQDWVTDRLTSAQIPTPLREAVARSHATYLLVTAGERADEGHAASHIATAAPDRVETWAVPGAGHTQGLETEPEEWARRVAGFLAQELGVEARGAWS